MTHTEMGMILCTPLVLTFIGGLWHRYDPETSLVGAMVVTLSLWGVYFLLN